jgi:hypothetical protein
MMRLGNPNADNLVHFVSNHFYLKISTLLQSLDNIVFLRLSFKKQLAPGQSPARTG